MARKVSESPTADANMPTKDDIVRLASRMKTLDGKNADVNDEKSKLVTTAVEKKNLHAAAFKFARRLTKMDAVKLYAFLTHFDAYREHLELDTLAGEALELEQREREEAEAQAEAQGAESLSKRRRRKKKGEEGEGADQAASA